MFAYTVDYINFYLYIFSISKESLRVQAPEYLHIESYNYSDTLDYLDWRIGWFYADQTDFHAKNLKNDNQGTSDFVNHYYTGNKSIQVDIYRAISCSDITVYLANQLLE